jgi:hypothetical protein
MTQMGHMGGLEGTLPQRDREWILLPLLRDRTVLLNTAFDESITIAWTGRSLDGTVKLTCRSYGDWKVCEKLSVLAVRRKSGMVLARRPDQHEGRYRVWMLSAPRDIELLGACCGLRAAERSSPVSDQAAASAAPSSLRRMLTQRIML